MNKIVFKARSRTESLIQPRPYPASEAIPDWWRNMAPYDKSPDNPDGKKILVRNRISNATFKKCAPLLDGITSGYIIPLWSDVQVTQERPIPLITWRAQHDIFQLHGMSSLEIPTPPGYLPVVFKYLNAWIPITPPGYSTMITSPVGYQNLPFKTIPAIVDTDKSTLELLFPMWVNENFEGIVEKGTPLVQLTPFKRDSWKAEFDTYEDDEYRQVVEEKNFNSTLVNHYIKKHWSKKSYK